MKHMTYKYQLIFLLNFLFLLIFQESSYPQFISNKGKPQDKYLNYAGRNYENYSSTFIRKKFFDNFGNFLVEGTTVYELNELQRQIPMTEETGGNSDIIKSRYYQSWFNNLVIANDAYGGFSTRLMVGDAIRTKFTAMTLNKARFNGIRWDAGTAKYRATFIGSRISDPIRFRFDYGLSGLDGIRRIRDWTQYLLGGHFETDIGDILTVGITYVNQHQRRSSIDAGAAEIKGVVTNAIPRVIFLKISDDSPGDNSGPVLFGRPQVIINGQIMPTVNMQLNQKPSGESTTLDKPVQFYCLRENERQLGFSIDQRYFGGHDTTSYTYYTHFASYRYYATEPRYPVQIPAVSTENVTYAFIMPEGVQSVQFKIMVANDYKIETAHDYYNTLDNYGGGALYKSHFRDSLLATPTPFFVRNRAEGNVRDGSNKQVVTVNYGLATGMSVYGLNFAFNWEGFEIEGEFNESVDYLKYPILSGSRYESKGQAWYIKGKKKLGRLTFGGEKYFISPDYITWLNTYVLENSYYIQSTGSTVLIPGISQLTAPDYLGYDASYTYQRRVLYPGGAFYPLVDDNDDNDRWEDGFYFYNVQATDVNERNKDVINNRGDFFKLGYRQSTNELRSLDAITRQPDAGIFPGKDKDNDGIPDDDRNANGVPDYSEDFLTYYADPPSFEYGDDWNNNGVIDDQENDIYPDYPYEPDTKGYHLFANLEVIKDLNVALGKISENAIARGGKNDVSYFKANYYTETPKFGSLRLYYVFKQVQDNILNNLYKYSGVITVSNPFPDYVIDPLYYRNSIVNSLYAGTKYTQIKGVNIENNFRIELNNQFKIGVPDRAFLPEAKLLGDQMPGNIVQWGLVNKIDYTIGLFNNSLKISPQFKLRTEKIIITAEDKSGRNITNISTHTQEVIPIVRIDYNLTPSTDLRFGLQGMSFFGDLLKYKIRNLKDNYGSQDRTTFAASISNKSQFAGYQVVFDFGYTHTSIDYLREADKTLGTEQSMLFFTIYAGF
ncbi:MAG: hypothetical protein GX452_07005 [Ignavibacteriales bacterium]|nr:hypothetical protein [Ignavibacteriales bacterium]HOJ18961.1 hypothetical protein [Ignavibacteriaceae bacterium]